MKWKAILHEAWANVLSGTSKTLMCAIALSLTIGGFVASDLVQIIAITHEAERYQASGASISMMVMPGGIDGAACEALNGVPGIRAAGALKNNNSDRLRLSLLPSAPAPIAEVTATFPKLLRATNTNGEGVILSAQVTERLGAGSQQSVATPDGDVPVAGIYQYPDDGRKSEYAYLVLVPTTDTVPFDECWADIWPQSPQIQTLLYTAAIPSKDASSSSPSIGQLNPTLGASFTGYTDYQQRLTKYAPFIAALLAFTLGFLSIRTRRIEIASNLHAGVSRSNQRTCLFLETLSWVLPAAIIGEVTALVIIASDMTADRSALLIVANRPIAMAVVGVFLGCSLAWVFTREKHLFAYFKTR